MCELDFVLSQNVDNEDMGEFKYFSNFYSLINEDKFLLLMIFKNP